MEDGLQRKDARLVADGLPPQDGPLSEGHFAIPTVFADTSNDWRLAREEIFGSVLVAIPWRDEADAPGHSYGGYKQSGIGREFSLEGMLDSFTQRKNVTVNLATPRRMT